MNAEQFCYWLQGSLELSPGRASFSAEQVQVIKDHLALVFKKVAPDQVYAPPFPAMPSLKC